MLLTGINHVAVLTQDTDRLHAFYRDVFDAPVFHDPVDRGMRLSFVKVGPSHMLNVFEIVNTEADRQTPMFGRGRLDHIGLEAASPAAFRHHTCRLLERGATDGFVTDFGIALSLFFRDPDGLEGKCALHSPAATPVDLKPPRHPRRPTAARSTLRHVSGEREIARGYAAGKGGCRRGRSQRDTAVYTSCALKAASVTRWA